MLTIEPDEYVAVEPPARRPRGAPRVTSAPPGFANEVADDAGAGVGALLEVRPRPRVRAGRTRRRGRREELEHSQRSVAVGEAVVPRVAPEEDAFARLGAHDLTGLRVGEHERPLEHVEQLVGGEHRPETLGVTERAARRKAEHDRVEQLEET